MLRLACFLGLGINLNFYATMDLMAAIMIPIDTVITVVRVTLAGGGSRFLLPSGRFDAQEGRRARRASTRNVWAKCDKTPVATPSVPSVR